jgi:hypothetical protein
MKKRIQQSMRNVGYEMGDISKGNGCVTIEIMNDADPQNKIHINDLIRDYGTHAHEALGLEEFRDLPKELDVGIDGNAVIVSFNRNGVDEALSKELDSFLETYCYLLKREKKESLELKRQSRIRYAMVG